MKDFPTKKTYFGFTLIEWISYFIIVCPIYYVLDYHNNMKWIDYIIFLSICFLANRLIETVVRTKFPRKGKEVATPNIFHNTDLLPKNNED